MRSRLARNARGAAAGLLVDRAFGEPPDHLHPVAAFGRAMHVLEQRTYDDTRGAGIRYAGAGIALSAAAATVVRSPATAVGIAAAGRELRAAAGRVRDALHAGDVGQARVLIPALVGRDPSELDASALSAAVIESLAENSVDAVVAPALWAAAAGASGALIYRAVNTMDAVVGHRSARYANFGWASARLDDIANYVPARVTALLVAAVRPRAARTIRETVRSDAPAHPSPNAGVAEASFAAALGVQLGGTLRYGTRVEHRPLLGRGPRPVPADINRAIALASHVELALVALLLGVDQLARGRGAGAHNDREKDMTQIPGIDVVLFDVGGTLVEEAAPGTPVDTLVARPLPGVIASMQALASHHRLGAVTDTAVMDEHAVRKLLAPAGIDALLDVVVTSTDVGPAKPDPAMLHEALRRLGAPAARALLIGDRDVDRDAAHAAGVVFAATDRGVPDAVARALARRSGAFGNAAQAVKPLDEDARAAARTRHDRLTKPQGALGRLEDLGVQLAAISGRCPPPIPTSPGVAVFAGDHGVVASGVTPWPQEITAQMVQNFATGGAAINVIARATGAAVHVVDVGVASDVSGIDGVHQRKIRAGTGDIAHEPAMTVDEATRALEVGADIARMLVEAGHDLLVTGEMGIGNTTPSAALIAAFTAHPAASVTGRGTGIDDAMLATKTALVAAAVARAAPFLDPVSVLAEVGGLEIAALAGFCIAGAAAGVPVLIDGVIACAALLVAEAIVPGVAPRCIAGHRSSEPGASIALAHLGLVPVLDLDLRLGEGTGACLAVPLVTAAAAVLAEMASFDDLAPG